VYVLYQNSYIPILEHILRICTCEHIMIMNGGNMFGVSWKCVNHEITSSTNKKMTQKGVLYISQNTSSGKALQNKGF